MTRLVSQDITGLENSWPVFDQTLFSLTGLDLADLAGLTLNLALGEAKTLLARQTVAVVPDTTGEGVILGFCETLISIAEHLGAKAFKTSPNEKGFKEALDLGATITLSSNDADFLAKNLITHRQSENGSATGRGFAQALCQMAGGSLSGCEVLVLGAGPVGLAAAQRLTSLGAGVVIDDLDPQQARQAAQKVSGAKVRPQKPPAAEPA
jgi:pyrrolysine biosynthesis protein PylD